MESEIEVLSIFVVKQKAWRDLGGSFSPCPHSLCQEKQLRKQGYMVAFVCSENWPTNGPLISLFRQTTIQSFFVSIRDEFPCAQSSKTLKRGRKGKRASFRLATNILRFHFPSSVSESILWGNKSNQTFLPYQLPFWKRFTLLYILRPQWGTPQYRTWQWNLELNRSFYLQSESTFFQTTRWNGQGCSFE